MNIRYLISIFNTLIYFIKLESGEFVDDYNIEITKYLHSEEEILKKLGYISSRNISE